MLPISVADRCCRTCFGGNSGNDDVADVADARSFGNGGNGLLKHVVADVADVAVYKKTKADLEIRRKLSDNKSPKPPNLEVV